LTTHLNEISLDELPKWSPWTSRLLGLEKFHPVTRDLNKVFEEYSQDKWQKCSDRFAQSGGTLTPYELRVLYYDLNSEKRRAGVINNRLVEVSNLDLIEWHYNALTSAMAHVVPGAKSIVELGCGMGQILWVLRSKYPGLKYLGGDYADSAVSLATKLYATASDITIHKFNYYDDRYDLIERAEGPIIIFTSQSLEQIPECANVIETLSRYKHKIARVFHMEPAYALYDDGSLLGQLRRRYIELNDYNRDLIPTLKSRKDVEILRLEPNIVGWNPFNSLALTEWRFC
jgi:hypothetical protein